MIANVAVVDLDGDRLVDVVAADAATNRITWLRQAPAGRFTERSLAEVPGPAHVHPVDLDARRRPRPRRGQPGRALSQQRPHRRGDPARERRAGAVHAPCRPARCATRGRRAGRRSRRRRRPRPVGGAVRLRPGRDALAAQHRRLAVREPDAAGVVGADQRRDRRRGRRPRSRHRDAGQPAVGGDLRPPSTTAAAASRRGGSSAPATRTSARAGSRWPISTPTAIPTWSTATATPSTTPPPPGRSWNGLQWLENTGGATFTYHRIADIAGASSPQAADLDGDGDLDIAVVSAYNNWASADGAEPGLARERRPGDLHAARPGQRADAPGHAGDWRSHRLTAVPIW